MFIKIKNKISQLFQIVLNFIRLKKAKKNLKHLHNIHAGQRCFIVGNGPSLSVEDLNKLDNEICFGTHRVFKIFNKTTWRPTYYCAQDSGLIYESTNEINQLDVRYKFIALVKDWRYNKIKDATYINLIVKEFYPNNPDFSEDITKGIYEGYTVSYMCLQLAIYMGFKDIYLIGIDHQYSKAFLPNGELEVIDTLKDHFSNEDQLANIPQLFKSKLSYESAKKYAEEHNINIFNATRGGALDVFERINFDSLF